MEKFISTASSAIRTFARDEEGAQVVEYALIVAVVSIGLAIALGDATTGLRSSFAALVTRVTNCFTAGQTCT